MSKGSRLSRLGPNQQKVLLLLFAGVGLSLARTPRRYFKVITGTRQEWQNINYRVLNNTIKGLYKSKLIREHENPDGSLTMILTERGKKKAITFNIDNMEIKKPKVWDKKWRMVLFDIPEKYKPIREVLRETLKRLGFYEYQKSVLAYPYPCQDEIDYIIEYFNMRPYVRIITVSALDNELHLKKLFEL
ncbi:MAG: hypothetical protein HYT38_00300 [Candidatus Sungbacteria bacterium]|uniref:Transcriptional repressor PaaX-like central Cas2-like domain-containing protein n=1 Tax=Candidatus Sungiibacteriota bacterium TaxID=2750080 RepID=A0A932DS35_9BACT|nr:hypothetical protein [Candidatus Sungbacteria bacterium]MBI2465766.1 hypothetical protein [Candidatus Sungbacteria bacterium]